MPLPALPANNTPQIVVSYTTGRIEHSFLVRTENLIAPSFALGHVFDILDTLSPVLPSLWAVTGVTLQEQGATFTLPIDPGPLTGFNGTNGDTTIPQSQEPRQISWTGRSVETGRDVRWGLFGLFGDTPATYRLSESGLANRVGAVCDLLAAASTAGVFVAIDGANVLWNRYANVNYNSYWETAARG